MPVFDRRSQIAAASQAPRDHAENRWTDPSVNSSLLGFNSLLQVKTTDGNPTKLGTRCAAEYLIGSRNAHRQPVSRCKLVKNRGEKEGQVVSERKDRAAAGRFQGHKYLSVGLEPLRVCMSVFLAIV